MKRLTEYVGKYAHGRPGKTYAEAITSTDICRGEFEATACVERLAAYEDTGLTPEEIPHWIPVSERLPEGTGHYLVISKMNWAHGGNWEDNSGDIRRNMAIAFFERVLKFNIPYVTHWMPLPSTEGLKNET